MQIEIILDPCSIGPFPSVQCGSYLWMVPQPPRRHRGKLAYPQRQPPQSVSLSGVLLLPGMRGHHRHRLRERANRGGGKGAGGRRRRHVRGHADDRGLETIDV